MSKTRAASYHYGMMIATINRELKREVMVARITGIRLSSVLPLQLCNPETLTILGD